MASYSQSHLRKSSGCVAGSRGEAMTEETVHLTVIPKDGLCEGCGEPIEEEIFETEDMVILCKPCWKAMLEESRES